jgi:tRNA(Ile)-lysidine synthase
LFKAFQEHIEAQKFFQGKENIWLAVSGGIDSMVLSNLMLDAKIRFSIAHFDHRTRQGASAEDASFVKSYCDQNKINCRIGTMIPDWIENNFQAEARRQRYDFFNTLNYDCLVTAHHQDDHVESILMNFLRGKSLNGIESSRNNIIRPLLPFSKAQITKYANDRHLEYRTDISNLSNDYLRNFVRNEILSKLKLRIPDLNSRIINLSEKVSYEKNLLQDIAVTLLKPEKEAGRVFLKKESIEDSYMPAEDKLFYFLNSYGFNKEQCRDIYAAIDHIGAYFKSESHELVNDRKHIILKDRNRIDANGHTILRLDQMPDTLEFGKYIFYIEKRNEINLLSDRSLFQCPLNKLGKTLILRYWKEGDHFRPFGMQGKSQSLKKFFTDNKIDRFRKKEIPLLCNEDGEILWIAGLRSSNYCLSEEKGEDILTIRLERKD